MTPLRTLASLALAGMLAGPVLADDLVTKTATGSVAEAMDRLEAAVTGAGATVFARVDHGAGAAGVDLELNDAQLLIFGNPKLGTPAMQQDMRTGLVLPLKMLVYADDDGQTHVTYEEVDEMFEDFGIDDDAAFVQTMKGALDKFSSAAAGG